MFYTSHLTQHTSHGALIFIDSILQDKNLCDSCDINCDRRDINDKVNQMNLYFQTVSILGWAFSQNIMKSITLINIVIPGNLTTCKLALPFFS